MFSTVKSLVYSVLGMDNYSKDVEENVEEVLKEINLKDEEEEDENINYNISQKEKIENSFPNEYNVKLIKCFHKTGKVTYIDKDYGFIDGMFYFNTNQVSGSLNLKTNDEVSYSAYRTRDNQTTRIQHIYALKHDSWEAEDNSVSTKQEMGTVEIPVMSRLVNGKVTRRNGRRLYIEPQKIWCDLDEVQSTFVPVEGDWVSLDVTAAIDKNAVDLCGNILHIEMLKPGLVKQGSGRITYLDSDRHDGAIENKIYFSKLFCTGGYIPTLGDEVTYVSIESDTTKFKWRALSVTPLEIDDPASFSEDTTDFAENLMMTNKEGIAIKPISMKVDVELHGLKEVSFEVSNLGLGPCILEEVKINSLPSNSQIRVLGPKVEGGLTIHPGGLVRIEFEVRGKYIGVGEETCNFKFNDVEIRKLIVVNVTANESMSKVLGTNCSLITKTFGDEEYVLSAQFKGTLLLGPKPYVTFRFNSGEKRGFYKVHPELWDVVFSKNKKERSKTQSVIKLEHYAPYMKEELDSSNYRDRFHVLLYLEEIELRKNFEKLNRKGIILRPVGEYLAIEIPSIGEQRPFPMKGDKVIVMQRWAEKKNLRQMGYIHQIQQNLIMVKFHESFHETYDESECDVVFEPALGTMGKAHDAVNRAMRKLGTKWLFPTKVDAKPSQIEFDVDDESKMESFENPSSDIKKLECKVDKNGYVINPKKKLVWFNKNLNDLQKAAIINALRGEGRPLPYIIFGPPGTGKTMTLVELAMQIHTLLPESRIMLSTPSNSACDLLCERLINVGKFKPGELVRIIAYHKAMNNTVPPKLVPYSTLIDISDDFHRPLDNIKTFENIKISSQKQFNGRQRIVAGTCGCIGSLHYMGFTPDHFTHILVDEAAQTSEPDCLISATFQNPESSQVIMAGDPQQLGPVCFSHLAIKYGLGVSLMQRLFTMFPYQRDFKSFPDTSGYDPRFVTKLKVTYRSVPEILSLPSKMFYNSELITTVSPEEGAEADIIRKFNFTSDQRDRPAALIFHTVVGQNYQESDSPSWFNPQEVWQVVTYLKKLYDLGLKVDDIGVIAPYVKQIQKIKYVLKKLDMEVPKVGTVEDFQGQERLVIIVSTVRSNLFWTGGKKNVLLGFLSCPRRLNVSLTRARGLLIILGNPKYLLKNPYWKTVVEYCKNNNSLAGPNVCLLEQNESKLRNGDTKPKNESQNDAKVPKGKGDRVRRRKGKNRASDGLEPPVG